MTRPIQLSPAERHALQPELAWRLEDTAKRVGTAIRTRGANARSALEHLAATARTLLPDDDTAPVDVTDARQLRTLRQIAHDQVRHLDANVGSKHVATWLAIADTLRIDLLDTDHA